MENKDELSTEFIIALTPFLPDLELENLAQQLVLTRLNPDLAILLPQIEAAKLDPSIQAMIRDKYDTPLAKFRATAETLGVRAAASTMLQEVRKAPKKQLDPATSASTDI
jgi:hypothetical protein